MQMKTPWLMFFAVLLAMAPLSADAGCWNCEPDYTDCQLLSGICSEKCEEVESGDGEASECTVVEAEPWVLGGGKVCSLGGNYCTVIIVNPDGSTGGGGFCPDGQVC